MNYQTEKEFLNHYDIKKYKQLSMTIDLLLVSISEEETNNYRKTNRKKMSVLLIKRDTFPFKGQYCLPGGFINPDKETMEECAKRVLKEEVNYEDIYLEQLYTFDSLTRDPRCRVISCSYMALVDKTKIKEELKDKASWFDIRFHEEGNLIDIELNNGKEILRYQVEKKLKEHSTDRFLYQFISGDTLAFDHNIVIITGIERLRNKINYTDVVFNMMPKYFTLGELQQVYEVILGKKLLDPAFRRIIGDKVKKTNTIQKGKGHRPSIMYEYKERE